MAVLRIQENIKKADGDYDVVHKETEAGLVMFDDGESLQQKCDAGLTADDVGALSIMGGTLNGQTSVSIAIEEGAECFRNIYAGSADLAAGSAQLSTGTIYMQYE